MTLPLPLQVEYLDALAAEQARQAPFDPTRFRTEAKKCTPEQGLDASPAQMESAINRVIAHHQEKGSRSFSRTQDGVKESISTGFADLDAGERFVIWVLLSVVVIPLFATGLLSLVVIPLSAASITLWGSVLVGLGVSLVLEGWAYHWSRSG